jgi:hypothetical protein
MINIIENFLPKNEFEEIKSILTSIEFPWYFVSKINNNHTDEDKFCYFAHAVFQGTSQSSVFNTIDKIFFKKINAKQYLRIKCNFYPRTSILEYHNKHIDFEFEHKGAIFYINNNDGFTILENGVKIPSKENTILFFDPSKKHCSTNCTDAKGRININFNYF